LLLEHVLDDLVVEGFFKAVSDLSLIANTWLELLRRRNNLTRALTKLHVRVEEESLMLGLGSHESLRV
jgi:hypothetical protein